MITALSLCKPFHRLRLQQQLRLVLASADEVEAALFSVEHAEAATMLPYQDIAEPYLQLITRGFVPGHQQLLRLLELSMMLSIEFAVFVQQLLHTEPKHPGAALVQTDVRQWLLSA